MQLASHAKTTYDANPASTRVDRWGVSSKRANMVAMGMGCAWMSKGDLNIGELRGCYL
jgi:hypothetical protein